MRDPLLLELARMSPSSTGTCLRTIPVSVVIPTMSSERTRWCLPWLIAELSQGPLLHNSKSEILISHGSNESFMMRDEISRRTIRELQWSLNRRLKVIDPHSDGIVATRKAFSLSQISHLLGPSVEMYAAARYYAAAIAQNEVIISIDDDVLPYPSQIKLLLELGCSVTREAGFPRYEANVPPPGLHGPQKRYCDLQGYTEPRGRGRAPVPREGILLTDFAAMSRTLVRRVVADFNESFGMLMRSEHGNGEDIAFAHAVKRHGGNFTYVTTVIAGTSAHGTRVRTAGSANSSYSKRHNHYPLRKVICCCLSALFPASQLQASSWLTVMTAGQALAKCVTDVYGCCPPSDPRCSTARPTNRCVSTRPSAHMGVAACQCGRFHFGQYNPQRQLWAKACKRKQAT